MGNGWLLVILCTIRLMLLVFLFFFLGYQVITIVVIDSGVTSWCNGFCGNNRACAVAIEFVLGIIKWSVMYKLLQEGCTHRIMNSDILII
jgi:hypothetical protein